jgi:hypothetical protein
MSEVLLLLCRDSVEIYSTPDATTPRPTDGDGSKGAISHQAKKSKPDSFELTAPTPKKLVDCQLQ